jgi:hypothetical protein
MDYQIIYNSLFFLVGYIVAAYSLFISGKFVLYAKTSVLKKSISAIYFFLATCTIGNSLLIAYSLKHPFFYKNYTLIDFEKLPFFLMFWFLVIEISFFFIIRAFFNSKLNNKPSIKKLFTVTACSITAVISTYLFIRTQISEFTPIKTEDFLSTLDRIYSITLIVGLILIPFSLSGLISLFYSYRFFLLRKKSSHSKNIIFILGQFFLLGIIIFSLLYCVIQFMIILSAFNTNKDDMGLVTVGGMFIFLYFALLLPLFTMIFLYHYRKTIQPIPISALKRAKTRILAQQVFGTLMILYIPVLLNLLGVLL